MKTLILAAGAGTRMHSQLPKVLHQIAGRSLLKHVYDTSCQLIDNDIFVIIGHGAEQVKQQCAELTVTWIEQSQQLGTGHAVQQAQTYLNDNEVILILYGDVPLLQIETLNQLLTEVRHNSMALLTVILEDPTGYGRIVRDSERKVIKIVEQKDATVVEARITEVNTGILAVYACHLTKWLAQLQNQNAQGEYYLTDIIEMAVNDEIEIHTLQPKNNHEVLGVNTRKQLADLERIYQLSQAQKLMETGGVSLADPNRIDIRGELIVEGQDIEIDVNVIFLGQNKLGHHIKIGANCIIKDSMIEDGVEILPNSIIENAKIGQECRIGPFARIRPETELAHQVHIGNFVEIKKSNIAAFTKINHLSYIGDSIIGQQVNIGAGTITCNYDGINKFQTIIEDGAFIGSDSQLIAPVIIGKNATIGAGSTISQNAPAEQLTLARSKQTSIGNWQRPIKKNN